MSDTTQPTPENLSSEAVWKLIEPRINEYWHIAKFVFWVVVATIGTLVVFFVGIILALLKTDAVKDALVMSVIKVDKLFDDNGKAFLNNEIDKYFRSSRPTLAFEENAPVKEKALKVFHDQFRSAVTNVVVAYSFSTTFVLSDAKKSYELRFIKPDGSSAEVECLSVYSTDTAKKYVHATLNNLDYHEPMIVAPKGVSYGRGRLTMEKSNNEYFPDRSKVSAKHSLNFVVDDDRPFDGSIELGCTVTVTGPARLAQQTGG
jgi:hypothetical protein